MLTKVSHGVPQGSVLGANLFTIYAKVISVHHKVVLWTPSCKELRTEEAADFIDSILNKMVIDNAPAFHGKG